MRGIGARICVSVFQDSDRWNAQKSGNDALFLVKDVNRCQLSRGGSVAPSFLYTTWVGESTNDRSANILNAQTCASQPQGPPSACSLIRYSVSLHHSFLHLSNDTRECISHSDSSSSLSQSMPSISSYPTTMVGLIPTYVFSTKH
jgi:hypothetical protein